MRTVGKYLAIAIGASALLYCAQRVTNSGPGDAEAEDAGADGDAGVCVVCPEPVFPPHCEPPCLARRLYSGAFDTEGGMSVQLQNFDPTDFAIYQLWIYYDQGPNSYWRQYPFFNIRPDGMVMVIPNQEFIGAYFELVEVK